MEASWRTASHKLDRDSKTCRDSPVQGGRWEEWMWDAGDEGGWMGSNVENQDRRGSLGEVKGRGFALLYWLLMATG